MLIVPRQAPDKHRENSKKARFVEGVVMLRYPLNITRQVVSDAIASADLDYYNTQVRKRVFLRHCFY